MLNRLDEIFHCHVVTIFTLFLKGQVAVHSNVLI